MANIRRSSRDSYIIFFFRSVCLPKALSFYNSKNACSFKKEDFRRILYDTGNAKLDIKMFLLLLSITLYKDNIVMLPTFTN